MATAIERLSRGWAPMPGFVGWMSQVNHRAVGARFIFTAMVFFGLAGVLALLMRIQLALPMLEILSPDRFNQFFTMHGTTMMFLFAVPIMEGFGIYLVPLMIGARDMAFPRLNAFGFWVYLIAGVLLYGALLFGEAPDSGWFNYVPLTGPGFSPGMRIDFWVTMITFLEVAALVAAIELIVTIFKMRAPGMTLSRMPLFVWSVLVMAIMIIFAMPPLMLTSLLLALDRFTGTHFFNVAAGGHHLLWQHLFWIFGHPEVYIILLPGLGIISAVVAGSVGRPVVAYTLVAMSTVAIGFLSFGLWVHHMYAVGLPLMGMEFFAAASMMITIPSGVQIFCWIATIWRGRPQFTTAFLFALGFIVIFILGGFTGVMVASVPFDWQVHDSYFVVAHFHYVLVGGAVFPIFAGLHFWIPKITGLMLRESLGKLSFVLSFIGFNITFFPMHILGFLGMPRRIYTYLPDLGWGTINFVSTIGAFILGLGFAVFLFNVYISGALRRPAGPNPWNAGTLEWATTSPPPQYNFRQIPVVYARYPLWQQSSLEPADPSTVRGWTDFHSPASVQRATIGTSILNADPEIKIVLPGPTLWPFWTALSVSVAFVGAMTHLWLVPVGAVLTAICVYGWVWPREEGQQ